MAIFNSSVPSNDEAVKLGASRIREVKTSLNSMLSQIFDDSFVFIPKFVTGSLIQNDASDNSLRAIDSNHIKTSAIILPKLLDGVFTADAPGRAKFAAGFVNSALLDPAITFPTGSVNEAALAALSVSTGKIQDGAVTLAKLVSTGLAKIAIGSYTGSDSVSVAVTGLSFAPDFLFLVGGKTSHKTGVSFKAEATADVGPVHDLWDSSTVGVTDSTAIQWTADGFIVVPFNHDFNDAGKNHQYLALKV